MFGPLIYSNKTPEDLADIEAESDIKEPEIWATRLPVSSPTLSISSAALFN